MNLIVIFAFQQDQIYLHEDEDGQLYFKDETGTLQPVYLTEDGNYSFTDQIEDDQEALEIKKTAEAAMSIQDLDSPSARQVNHFNMQIKLKHFFFFFINDINKIFIISRDHQQ